MDLQAEYQPTRPIRPAYSLVDSIKLYRRQHGDEAPLRIMMIGDSVTGQYFAAALCDALRNEFRWQDNGIYRCLTRASLGITK